MVTVRPERPADVVERERLLDVSYGPARFGKTSERLREGRLPELSFVAAEGRRLVGTVQLWSVSAGPCRPALLLGPLAVAPDCRKRGIGSTLVQRALREAVRLGHRALLPGPYERHRLLARELAAGALEGARGLVSAAGRPAAKPDLAALVASLAGNESVLASHAA